ncbi:S-adenosyl-L-homocysteine hydrolase [Aeropyrum camini SY1 = JCM 12091]|uniref:Adenosylhomocysteinase n=1 Tax=Aeropyrum camini SY1 = JCM 12091 TaxID=1198449 RepID=U3TF26_9CREN|nr:adenosylhomocysteinase [Aeropyrum camini]BAN89944.1 S-adenosyl-L-homocysteine hydrolase [Aeropyrum camini SY1 = JCM 12091]
MAQGFKVRDPSLAGEGRMQIEWAERHMPVLMRLRSEMRGERPLRGVRVAACLHVTKETAVLVETLREWGAEVYLAPSNPLSTQDEVAAALAEAGIGVFAWRGMTPEEYNWALTTVAGREPDIVIDDGADLHVLLHEEMRSVGERVWGGTEETTTGVIRLRALEREGRLLYPVIAVNDALTKFMFDNRYGTGQSTVDGVLRATNILIAGKTVVVAGYGWVGRGIAARFRGMGARVVVTEVDPIRALEAAMDGFSVATMDEAASVGDVFITATGNINVIDSRHMEKMKDGAILANAGHFNVEINVKALEEMSVSKRRVRRYLDEYTLPDGRRLYLIGEGRLVNLVAAEGHPSEVMDMSFSNQALAVLKIARERGRLEKRVHRVERSQDEKVASLKLETMGIRIDRLTEEQRLYLQKWK